MDVSCGRRWEWRETSFPIADHDFAFVPATLRWTRNVQQRTGGGDIEMGRARLVHEGPCDAVDHGNRAAQRLQTDWIEGHREHDSPHGVQKMTRGKESPVAP